MTTEWRGEGKRGEWGGEEWAGEARGGGGVDGLELLVELEGGFSGVLAPAVLRGGVTPSRQMDIMIIPSARV